jgi:RNA polymerase primary sigma factor
MRQLKITKQVTNRETASLDKYLQEIGKVDLITAEEEVELAQRIKAGDQIALEKLTKANLRFVVSVAKQYQNQGLTLPDLINEGNLGLIKAAQRFDETRGFKFTPMLYGGFVNQFFKLWLSNQELFVCL